MLFDYNGLSLKGGIYQIKNLLTDAVYVGSAGAFKNRWSSHAYALKSGDRKSTRLNSSHVSESRMPSSA